VCFPKRYAGNHKTFKLRGCRQFSFLNPSRIKDFGIMSVRVLTATGSLSDNAPNPQSAFRTRLRGLLALISLTGFLVSVGCGDSEVRVPVFPVTGKVTYQGQTPVGAQIVLHPVKYTGPDSVTPIGTVLEDGSFKVTAYDPGDGAPQGDYVATVQWFKMSKELNGPGPNVIPKKYSDPATSPIKVTVAGGGPTEIPPITIASK
jgi:hypothetical protein